jgi:uncharacterized phiE125 gp8 family phage protein
MDYALREVTGPSLEPVPVATAKKHLRIDGNDEGEILALYVKAARLHVENHISGKLISQTWEMVLDGFPEEDEVALPLPPLQSVTSIKYTPDGGSETTFDSANYVVDADSFPGRIVLDYDASWPSDTLVAAGGVVIRFVAGYGDAAADVPEPIRQAILLYAGDLYENREDTLVAQGFSVTPLPNAARMLLASYRKWSL